MNTVKQDTPQQLVAFIKRLAPTQKERAALLGWSVRQQRRLEHGDLGMKVLRLMSVGALVVPGDVEEAHDDTTQGGQ